eukprot:5765675-Pyramimonas_sp.AAC.1
MVPTRQGGSTYATSDPLAWGIKPRLVMEQRAVMGRVGARGAGRRRANGTPRERSNRTPIS